MEQIFEKDIKGFIVPLFKKDIYQKSFNNFFNLVLYRGFIPPSVKGFFITFSNSEIQFGLSDSDNKS